MVGELLFEPYLNELECKSLPESIWGAIQGCDVDCRADIGKSVVLSGGNSMLTGLQERLKAEITKLAPDGLDIVVMAAKDRKNAVWKGTSMMSSLSTFAACLITKADFKELGARGSIAKKNP